jgi:putative membrane protein
MFYGNYGGMNIIWWFVWGIFLFWIFITPYDIPGQRKKRNTALEILQQRYAQGQLTTAEYQERKKVLQQDLASQESIVVNNKKSL